MFKEYITEMANLGDKTHHLGSTLVLNIHQGESNKHGPRVKIFKKQNPHDYATITINRKTKALEYIGTVPKWFKGSTKKSTEIFINNNSLFFIELYDDMYKSPDDYSWVK